MHKSLAVCTVGIAETTATIMLKHWTHTSISVVGSLQSFKNIDAIVLSVVFSISQTSGSKLAMFTNARFRIHSQSGSGRG